MIDRHRLAIVGRGYMARRHIAAIERHPRVRLCGVIGRGEPLDVSEADAVLICSPDATHPAYVAQLLPTAKLVFCEKPLARTAAEFDTIRRAAPTLDRLAVGMNCRFRRRIQHLKTLLDERELGRVRLVRGTYSANVDVVLQDGAKRWWLDYPAGMLPFLHGGALHLIDALRFLFGEVEQAQCVPIPTRGSAALGGDSFIVVLWFADGPVAEIVVTGTSYAPNRFQIAFDAEHGSVDDRGVYVAARGETPQVRALPDEDAQDLDRQMEHLIAVLDGSATPLNTFDEAFRNFTVIRACEESVRTGTRIRIAAGQPASASMERPDG